MLNGFSTPLAYWMHNLDPFAVKFPEGFFVEGIRWYGVSYVLAFIIGAYLVYLYCKKGLLDLTADQRSTLFIVLMAGVLIGGRLGYVLLYDTHQFFSNPLILFKITQGGMASHGGIVGVIVAIYWFSKKYGKSFGRICDVAAVVGPLGIFLGRIANFINGELWGKVTDVPWAVIFPTSAPWMPLSLIPARHPSQLYEALFEGLILFLYLQWRFWKKSKLLPHGQLIGEFFLLYGVARILCEVFREPDASLILGLSRGQFYSFFLILAGAGVIAYVRKRARV